MIEKLLKADGKRYIKKTFDYKGEDNFAFLKNEVFWLNYLKSKWVPELEEVGLIAREGHPQLVGARRHHRRR